MDCLVIVELKQNQKYSSLFERSIMLSEVDLWVYLLLAKLVVNVSKSFLSVVPSLYSKIVSYNILWNSILKSPLRKYLSYLQSTWRAGIVLCQNTTMETHIPEQTAEATLSCIKDKVSYSSVLICRKYAFLWKCLNSCINVNDLLGQISKERLCLPSAVLHVVSCLDYAVVFCGLRKESEKWDVMQYQGLVWGF